MYFGERYKPDNCGMCSHCKPKEGISNIVPTIDKNYAADEEIEKVKDLFKIKNEDNIKNKLIKLVALYTIPSKDFIKLVRGELHHFASRRIKDLPCCGMLKGETEEIIYENIKEIVDVKWISESSDGTLRLTKKGIIYLKESYKEK